MFYKLFFLFICVLSTSSFAQVRDLFAEFEAEVSSSSTIVSSSSAPEAQVGVSSSSVNAVSSSSQAVKQTPVVSSSSLNVVSSSSQAAKQTSVASSSSLNVVSSSSQTANESPIVSSSSSSVSELSSSSEAVPATPIVSSSSSIQVVAPIASSSSISRRDLLGPVKVSKIRGINEMKGAYKSPRKALFMSLVLPGAGQIYVGTSAFNNVRGGVYIALEAALWSGWFYYSVHKYNKQVSRYESFANKHFSVGTYEQEMHNIYLLQLEDASEEANFRVRYLNSRESYCKSIYGTATTNNCYSADNLFNDDSRHLSSFDKVSLGESRKGMSFYDDNQFYQLIANPVYVLGWDDVSDRATYQQLGLTDSESETIPLGSSSNLNKYKDMRDKANDYASMQAWFFGGLILNHVISAFDAALTANAHNKVLYEEKLSWLDQVHLGSSVSFFDGFMASVQAYWNF